MTRRAEVRPGSNVAIVTLDTLRFDVARAELTAGRTPHLQRLVGDWEPRHTPASFTYAAHLAFLAGFLPTPIGHERQPRLFAVAFGGSETTDAQTFVVDRSDLPRGFAALGYHTVCIGGTGFFDPSTPLGSVLTSGFDEVRWEPAFRVTEPESFDAQIDALERSLGRCDRPAFVLLNVSVIHQPNRHYQPDAPLGPQHGDSLETHAAALRHVDRSVPRLIRALTATRPALLVICSDHGTAYGDDGYVGHRLGHPCVWTVPYAEVEIDEGAWL